MKQVKLTIIYNDIWSINETYYEYYIGSFLKRIIQKYVNIGNDFIISLFNTKLNKNVNFIMIDETYHLLTLNSKIPKKLTLILIDNSELTGRERQYIFDEKLTYYIYLQNEIFQINNIFVESNEKEALFDKKIVNIIEKVIRRIENNRHQKRKLSESDKLSKIKETPSIKKNIQSNVCKKTNNKKNIKIQPPNLKVYKDIPSGIKLIKQKKETLHKIVEKKENIINNKSKDIDKKSRLIDKSKKKTEVKQKPSKIEVVVLLREPTNTILTLFNKEDTKQEIIDENKNKKNSIESVKNNQNGLNKKNTTIKEKKQENSSNNILSKVDNYNNSTIDYDIDSNLYYGNDLGSTSITTNQMPITFQDIGKRKNDYLKNSQTNNNENIGINDKYGSNKVLRDNKKNSNNINKSEINKQNATFNKLEDTKSNDSNQSQIISYTIILPTGEILYHKEQMLINPISVEELLLQTGLDINNSNGFIESINGIFNQGMSGWVYEVNNMPIMVSSSDYIVNPNETITWKYVDFSKIEEREEQRKENNCLKKTLHKKIKI